MIQSRVAHWSYRWALYARTDAQSWATFWFLLVWGIGLMGFSAWSPQLGAVTFMTGLAFVMGAWHQFERAGFIQLLEESDDRESGGSSVANGDSNQE